ncbi:hypothetical protein JTE90_023248 [Oedothorax gibbosus]|uniref:CUB domain-containing protein n=1 Tax=Oedothorax gibbosus TaxID=931172 RepID=A0AAV6U4Q2_9ARAC|nr:hypothetical protein JTE90_023248 [Oedothorax gibbosus]
MEISLKWIILGILIFKVSIAACFYSEFIIEDFCKHGNETVIYDPLELGAYGTLKATSSPPYSSNKNCLIFLEPPVGRKVVLSVRKIDMRESLNGCLDYLEIFHADVFTSPTKICRFKHDLKEKRSFYSKGAMQILFHVDDAKSPRFTYEEGFTLTYTIVSEDIKDCVAADSFMCANERCITRDVICDGRNNCGDSSDESYELCGLSNNNTFYFLQMTDVLYVILICILILSIIITCGVFTFRRRRPRLDTDLSSDTDEPTARLTPYQAIHPTGFFICQNPAGPNPKTVHFDGGFSNPCYPNGFPQPPPPYSQ